LEADRRDVVLTAAVRATADLDARLLEAGGLSARHGVGREVTVEELRHAARGGDGDGAGVSARARGDVGERTRAAAAEREVV
jgi:hypothetical protein